jgi:predicted DNA-binding transcriptional regulator YafY
MKMIDYVLKTSLERHQVATIIYQNGEDITKRDIRIIKIENDYVEAYCYLRHQIRKFKIDNILSASLYIH